MIRPLEKGRKSPAKNNMQQYNENQIVNSPNGLHVGNGHDWQEMWKNFSAFFFLSFREFSCDFEREKCENISELHQKMISA